MALAKYFEDNKEMYEERLRDMEEKKIFFEPNVKSKRQRERERRTDVFCDKQGVIDIVKRGDLAISMEFKRYLYPEWVDVLKKNGWRWDHFRKYWYAPWTEENYRFATLFAHGKDLLNDEADDVYVDGYIKVL